MLANQIKGQNTARVIRRDLARWRQSWISARVTKYALEREFHDHNKASCDVECWLLYEATAC